MKVLIVCNATLEEGRGPVTRLVGVLPYLTQECDVAFVSLGPWDKICGDAISANCKEVFQLPFALSGWFVRDLDNLTEQIVSISKSISPDLVILYWEIWDLMRSLSENMNRIGIPFGVILHGMPFLNAPPIPSKSFALDVLRRLAGERNWQVFYFILRRVTETNMVIRRCHIISISETMDYYLKNYFRSLSFFSAIPGYALNLTSTQLSPKTKKRYDFAFMAKLVEEKGIFMLPDIMSKIKLQLPKANLIMIGSFEEETTRKRFLATLEKNSLKENIQLTGWVPEEQKYEFLRSARVFLYPSLSSDTFSFCLLEALACGVPAVCYDEPFTRCIYQTDAVKTVRYRDNITFSRQAVGLLEDEINIKASAEAAEFALRYSSWERVARAEVAVYRRILQEVDGVHTA